MHRIFMALLAAIVLLLGTASTSQAQSCPANSCTLQFSASVSISSTISCTVVRGAMNLGTHFKSEGFVSADETTALRAVCSIDPANGIVDVSFPSLPSTLSDGAGHTLPIIYGTESLRLYDCNGCGTVPQGVNPAVPQSKTITSGYLTLALGENGPNDPAGEVKVDLRNASAAGTYTAVITAQVALR